MKTLTLIFSLLPFAGFANDFYFNGEWYELKAPHYDDNDYYGARKGTISRYYRDEGGELKYQEHEIYDYSFDNSYRRYEVRCLYGCNEKKAKTARAPARAQTPPVPMYQQRYYSAPRYAPGSGSTSSASNGAAYNGSLSR